MDFADKIKDFSIRVSKLKDNLNTEEATKTSIVMPFFSLLGYDIFNPLEFVPEYTADTGTKKGEKVDYAILRNGDPIMIIEVKAINVELTQKHMSQLFRYFTVTKARFGILTNGIIYRFYSDLEEPNKMDLTPFLEIDLTDLKPDDITELKKFCKEFFNMKGILNSASELKYTSLLKNAIAEQFANPSDQFVRALIKNIYTGTKTQAVIDKFRDLTITAMNDYISDILNERLKTVISTDADNNSDPKFTYKEWDFLPQEIEALDYVKEMLHADDVVYKKVSQYAYMHVVGSQYKWVCRVYVRQDKCLFVLHKFDTTNYETEYYFDEADLLSQIESLIVDTYHRCKQM